MNKGYNSRQRKIYIDYNVNSTESLFEMIHNRNKYISEVISIVEDILVERKAMFPPEEKFQLKQDDKSNSNVSKIVAVADFEKSNNEKLKSFVRKLQEKSPKELSAIITRYISYEPETVEAALFLSVEKGIISFDLKVNMLKQIKENFAAHQQSRKRFNWESDNAFIQYVSGYQDEEVYNAIEDPSDIVIDVYHAILSVARDRELITNDDFTRYYKDAKAAIRSEREIINDELDTFFAGPPDFKDEVEMEEEKTKYWKCPSCCNLVGMEFGVCWNCQTEIPAVIEHPDTDEIIKEKASQREYSPIKTGFILIGGGIFVSLLAYFRGYTYSGVKFFFYGRLVFAGFFILLGISFLIYGLISKPKTS
jgi:hypothetical protein